MKEILSTYECSHCKSTKQYKPASPISCTRCNIIMIETVKGVITKGVEAPPAGDPAESQNAQPPADFEVTEEPKKKGKKGR